MSERAVHRGDLFLVDWSPGRGSEQAGERPALVIQNDPFNRNGRYPNTIVVAVSKAGRSVPAHVAIPRSPENGLWEEVSYVKCEQILTTAKERLGRRLGRISSEQMAQVDTALKRVLSLR